MLIILNSSVLARHGRYDYSPIRLEAARRLVRAYPWISAVGHAATAQVISAELDVPVPMRREAVFLEPGDRALVLKLLQRPAEGTILDCDALKQVGYRWDLLTRLS